LRRDRSPELVRFAPKWSGIPSKFKVSESQIDDSPLTNQKCKAQTVIDNVNQNIFMPSIERFQERRGILKYNHLMRKFLQPLSPIKFPNRIS